MRILIIALLIIPTLAFAAKPVSIKYIEDIVTEDEDIYAYHIVKCSNGKSSQISAWNNRKLWCAGKGLKDECKKKQIKSAKMVCKRV